MRHPVRTLGQGLLALGVAACGSDVAGPGLELPVACDEANTLTLDVGAGLTLSGSQARTLCVRAPADGAEFLLVPFAATETSSEGRTVSVMGENVRSAEGPPSPAPRPVGAGRPPEGLRLAGAVAFADPTLHGRIRELERRELRPLIRFGPEAAPAVPRAAGSVPSVGDLLTLNAQARSACQDPLLRTGRVAAVTDRAIVVADTLNPSGGFTDAEYHGFGRVFDTLVIRVNDRNFGTATNLGGTGRVILFFTPEVNRLSEPGSSRFVGGFFFARDLFPRVGTPQFQGCPNSNEAEVLYLMVPDPGGSINGNGRSKEFVSRSTPNTLVHEHQHLVNAARRLHILQSPEPFEDVWLNEALSHTAEELLFFEITGLAPRRNLALADLQQGGEGVIPAANAHLLPNILRFETFLAASDEHSPYDEEDGLETRGAAQHLVRYVADRRGGDDAQLFRALVDAPEKGFQNLAARLGGPDALRRLLAEWSVAIYASHRVPGLASRFHAPTWDYPTLFEGLDIRPFPIRTHALAPDQERSVQLLGGGALHLRFGVDADEVARIVFNSDGSPIPPELQVSLLRTR
jgi:hypothetical protein